MKEVYVKSDKEPLLIAHNTDTGQNYKIDQVIKLLNEQHWQIQSQATVIEGYQNRVEEEFRENKRLKKIIKCLVSDVTEEWMWRD